MKHLFLGDSIKNVLKIRIIFYQEVLFTPDSLHYACLASRAVQFAAGRTSRLYFAETAIGISAGPGKALILCNSLIMNH